MFSNESKSGITIGKIQKLKPELETQADVIRFALAQTYMSLINEEATQAININKKLGAMSREASITNILLASLMQGLHIDTSLLDPETSSQMAAARKILDQRLTKSERNMTRKGCREG